LNIIIVILYACLGWLVGVAINHAGDLLPRRETLLQGPRCLGCNAPRPVGVWSALLALVQQKVACAACGRRRDRFVRAVAVELIAPTLFVLLLERYGLSFHLGLVSIYTAILLLITVTDLEHRLILNVVILPAILLALAGAFVTPGLFWPSAMVGGGGAFVVVYLAALLARGGLGSGDVTLSAFLGLILGFPYIVFSLMAGVFLGGIVSGVLLLTGRVGLKSFIPYGPFLTVTGWLMLVWGPEIWRLYFG
jgi:prepilin signal peptidase PulO-like enzyme (type II secretory pathway)